MKLNIQLFASTNKTANYELPQFVGTDKPTWLGDFNEAMSDIDVGMHENASDIASMKTDVTNAAQAASQASQDVTKLTATVNTLSSTVTSVQTTANNAQSTANSALNVANSKVGTSDLLDLVYPVGSIYLSVNSTTPATLFGGTWEQVKDTFLLGSGDSYTLGNTGGEATHKLTVDEIPSHTHSAGSNSGGFFAHATGGINYDAGFINTNGEMGWYRQPANTGGGQAHNNMPPYLVVSIWKRVS